MFLFHRRVFVVCDLPRCTHMFILVLLPAYISIAGFWLEEAAAPHAIFTDAGYEVDIASPEGGAPPVDAGSKV